jgi:mono/diheme cytochrome c family protein
MRKSVVLLAALALVTCSRSVFAADAKRGKEFARHVCALCHVVMEGQNQRDPDAPSFQAIATSQRFREQGMEVLSENHPKMPNIALTQQQSDDVGAYIRSPSS